MKHLMHTLVILGLLAVITGFVCYRVGSDPSLHAAATKGDPMEWLRVDFHLNDAQYAAIHELHDSYAGSCAKHCRLIQQATKVRNALQTTQNADPIALIEADHQLQELRTHCATAITRHIRQVAALMLPVEGQRYLALVLPKIANFDHQAVPDLKLSHSS